MPPEFSDLNDAAPDISPPRAGDGPPGNRHDRAADRPQVGSWSAGFHLRTSTSHVDFSS